MENDDRNPGKTKTHLSLSDRASHGSERRDREVDRLGADAPSGSSLGQSVVSCKKTRGRADARRARVLDAGRDGLAVVLVRRRDSLAAVLPVGVHRRLERHEEEAVGVD